MGLHHSEQTHQALLDRLPKATGKELPEWFAALESGPSFGRFDDRVTWLRSEYGLAHGHATAIVHEHALQRSRRSFQ